MTTIFPDLLRAAVTDIMLVLLLYTMSSPKYGKKSIYISATLGLVVLNLWINTYFYLQNDYTSVAKVDLLMLFLLVFSLKPLFRETMVQWCFSFVTLLNIYAAVVIISYSACDFFPHPFYANTLLRLLLFVAVTFVLWRYFLPLYREVLKRWNAFIPMLVGLFINLVYFMFGKDIEQMLTVFMWPLLLLILLEILIYVSIFYGMNIMARENALKEENIKMQSEQELLRLSALSMAERLRLMDEVVHQSNLAAHDRRHFNSMVLELLEQGKSEDAASFLRKQVAVTLPKDKRYCENTAINAVVCYYAGLAWAKGITTDIGLDISNELATDSLAFSMAIANLLENAVHGCEALPETAEKYLRFTCRSVGRLALEISNPCTENTALGTDGFPKAEAVGHGVGTKSVLAFANKYDAELYYRIENNVFTVRLLI